MRVCRSVSRSEDHPCSYHDITSNLILGKICPRWYLKSPLVSCNSNADNEKVFIFGVNFEPTRLVSRSLQSFYGIGPQVRTRLMAKFHIHKTAKVGSLGDKQINDLAAELSTMTLENDLKRQLVDNIRRLRDMGTYRGRRHAMGLPVRGQRTRTQVRPLSIAW